MNRSESSIATTTDMMSRGEADMVKDLRELAIQNYERSLQLDPMNDNAIEQLRKLRAGQ